MARGRAARSQWIAGSRPGGEAGRTTRAAEDRPRPVQAGRSGAAVSRRGIVPRAWTVPRARVGCHAGGPEIGRSTW